MAIRAAAPALAAALLFGASTPLAKLLVGEVPPLLLAGLLYLGSGLGLAVLLSMRLLGCTGVARRFQIVRADWPWLLGATLSGGIVAPAFLMFGLGSTTGATASLLLNIEGVLTAVLAWVVFKENTDLRIVLGMLAIVAGGAVLSWKPGEAGWAPGSLLIVAACLAWAVDNNLTRKVSTNDAMLVACLKGLLAGVFNTVLAIGSGVSLPAWNTTVGAMAIGLLGYGVSLTLFVLALRTLGTARTGAYFSVAPLFGVVVSLIVWPAWPSLPFWTAMSLMGLGVWLHVRERHEHAHQHGPMEHAHSHRHDIHHRHHHDEAWDAHEPHAHLHRHEILSHGHPHYPDIHHRHGHSH